MELPRGRRQKAPGHWHDLFEKLLENVQSYLISRKEKEKKRKVPSERNIGNFSTLYMIFIQVVDISRGIGLSDTRLFFFGGHTGLVFMFTYVR